MIAEYSELIWGILSYNSISLPIYKIKYKVNYNSSNPISLNLVTSRFLIDYVHTWYFNVDSEYVSQNVSSSSENVDVIRIKHDCMRYRGWYLNH